VLDRKSHGKNWNNEEGRKESELAVSPKLAAFLSLSVLNVSVFLPRGRARTAYLLCCGSKALTDIPSAGTRVAKGTVHLFGTNSPLYGTAKSKSVWSPFASKASLPSTK
jgi:hypothetical protein